MSPVGLVIDNCNYIRENEHQSLDLYQKESVISHHHPRERSISSFSCVIHFGRYNKKKTKNRRRIVI